jgi:hypothetical protein
MLAPLLCVQFRNLLPSEELLLFARTLWEATQRDGLGALQARDATLCISKTESDLAPFVASLALASGSLTSVASGLEPLAAIESAFSQLSSVPVPRMLLAAPLLGETATAESQADTSTL